MPDLTDKQLTELNLGDRVRVNGTCAYQECIGEERFVVGISVRKDLTINIWLADHWPPRDGGDDGWSPNELDKVT